MRPRTVQAVAFLAGLSLGHLRPLSPGDQEPPDHDSRACPCGDCQPELVLPPVDVVDECAYCIREYTGPPVTSAEQRYYLGGIEKVMHFCSVSCLDSAAEEYGLREHERRYR